MKMSIRIPLNYDAKAASDEAAYSSNLRSRTQQQFKEETDINFIVNQFLKTGIPPAERQGGQFVDLLDMPNDYKTALDFIHQANGQFMDLPAEIRAYFQNDPGQALAFLENPDNYEKGVELGLFKRREVIAEEPAKMPSSLPEMAQPTPTQPPVEKTA